MAEEKAEKKPETRAEEKARLQKEFEMDRYEVSTGRIHPDRVVKPTINKEV